MDGIDLSYQSPNTEQNLPRLVAQLYAKVEEQAQQLQQQGRQIQHLEDRLVASEYKASKLQRDTDWFGDLKRELLNAVIEQVADRQLGLPPATATPSSESTRPTRPVTVTPPQPVEPPSRPPATLTQSDFETLHERVLLLETYLRQLQRDVAERLQGVSFLTEQRQTDSYRLAELQAELPTLERRVEESLTAKIDTLERRLPQFALYQMELEQLRQEWKQHQANTQTQIAQRERQMKAWVEQTQAHEHLMGKYDTLFERYTEQYQANKRLIETLQNIQEELQREKHQAQELQRLYQERQQAMFDKWKNDYEQKWLNQSSQWKPNLTEIERNIETIKKQVQDILKFNKAVEEQLDMILQILEEDMYNRTTVAESWQHRFETIAQARD